MNKIKKINELLNDDFQLQNYINEIEKNQIQKPKDLEEKIFSKINKKKKTKYADICKIAACLIFSLAVCRTDFIINDDIKINREEKVKITPSISEKLSDFCKWAITPIEKEEK